MTFERFHNALRVLRSIDRHEFNDAGYALTEREWTQFRDDPYGFFVRANRELAGGIWQIIESRQKPDPAVEALRRLLADHDPERDVIDVPMDGGCVMCVSFTPVPTHLCPYHAAKKIVDAANHGEGR